MRDAERDLPMTKDTIFRIYSMTKPIVSSGLMRLYEQGLFQLDDPVEQHLRELADLKVYADPPRDPARRMTIRDLLMHTSGLGSHTAKTPVGELYRAHGLTSMDSEYNHPGRSALPLARIPQAFTAAVRLFLKQLSARPSP